MGLVRFAPGGIIRANSEARRVMGGNIERLRNLVR